MEAAHPLKIARSTVEIRDGAVVIDGLVVDDRTLVELVERRLEHAVPAEDTVRDAVEIGARVLDREATGAQVEVVKRELEKVSGEVERSFADRARAVAEDLEHRLQQFLGEDDGAVAKLLDTHNEALTELIARHFGGDRSSAVQNQVRDLVRDQLLESRQDLLKQFSAADGHNPLADFKQAVTGQLRDASEIDRLVAEKLAKLEGEVNRLRDAREAQAELEAERERGTAKGRSFEDRAFDVVEELARARGDVAHHVGDERSPGGGKLGDIVIELEAASGEARGRIALDAKDERLSKNDAWRVLNGALDEREAGFAILVVAGEEKVPAGREELHEYEGNKMIVVLDRDELDTRALELAYRYARCRCLLGGERDLQLDAAGVRDAVQGALSGLKDAQKMRQQLTSVAKGAEGARGTLDTMVAGVEASLERAERLIS